MKMSELKQLIEESVRKVVREELKNIGTTQVTNSTSQPKPIRKNTSVQLSEEFRSSPAPSNVIIRTGNSMLDKVLSETTPGFSQTGLPTEDIDQLDEAENAEAIKNISPEVHSAMTRDYSSFLKKVQDKAKK